MTRRTLPGGFVPALACPVHNVPRRELWGMVYCPECKRESRQKAAQKRAAREHAEKPARAAQ